MGRLGNVRQHLFGEVANGLVDCRAGNLGDVLRGEDDLVQALDRGELLNAGNGVFPVAAEGEAVDVLVRDAEFVRDVGAGVL